MRRCRPLLLAPLAALTCASAAHAQTAPAGPAYAAETPQPGHLYEAGPSGRYLLDGQWLFRLDPTDVGMRQGFARSTDTAGWSVVSVPNAWNATDESEESMKGTVGWYRKDFQLPSTGRGLAWIVRFESVNYRSRVWLNGHPIGKHSGAYLPFELRLPPSYLKRTGVNRLAVRVDNRRYQTDFPPSGLSVNLKPTGGWWNYGGLLREVYLRKVDEVDLTTVRVLPRLPCSTCAASVELKTTVRNYATSARRISVSAKFDGRSIRLGSASVGAKRFATFGTRVRVSSPRLWSPSHPTLYPVTFTASSGGGRQTYFLRTGIRSIRVSKDGHLLLNGHQLHFRGVGLHEDSLQLGFAVTNQIRAGYIASVKELGATLIRSHYPLHPQLQELADREGVLLWSEIPVYAIKTEFLKQRIVRQLAANELRDNILVNGNHPSVIVWSIANELSSRPGPVQSYYIQRAADTAHELDPTRPVGIAVAGFQSAGCSAAYEPLDVVGINEYFGWYPGPNGQTADRTLLPEYLDAVRRCYPDKAVVVSEFGAEANRDGPVEEKGTYAFQQDFVRYHLGVIATKPWLSGAVYWALQEFRVRPGWEGGNPRPQAPIHQKGLLTFAGAPKPAWFDTQQLFKATDQLGGA
jgi:beta-galactosidase/beta-glucuronidase